MTRSQINGTRARRLVRDPCGDERCPTCYGDPAAAETRHHAGQLPDRTHRIEELPETD